MVDLGESNTFLTAQLSFLLPWKFLQVNNIVFSLEKYIYAHIEIMNSGFRQKNKGKILKTETIIWANAWNWECAKYIYNTALFYIYIMELSG